MTDLNNLAQIIKDLDEKDMFRAHKDFSVDRLEVEFRLETEEAKLLWANIQDNTFEEMDFDDADFQEAMEESIHQSFDGWEPDEQVVIVAYLYDLRVAAELIKKGKALRRSPK